MRTERRVKDVQFKSHDENLDTGASEKDREDTPQRQPHKPCLGPFTLIGILALLALASPIRAAVFLVPDDFTLQGAVDAALTRPRYP